MRLFLLLCFSCCCALVFFLFYPRPSILHIPPTKTNTLPSPPKNPEKTAPRLPQKSLEEASEELRFLWTKGFLLPEGTSVEEFLREYPLELQSRFNESRSILEATSPQLEAQIFAGFPLVQLPSSKIPKFRNLVSHFNRYLLLSWRVLENIQGFLLQSTENARLKGIPVHAIRFMEPWNQSFQSTLGKEKIYRRLWDYFFFLEQVALQWSFSQNQIQVHPPELQETFNLILADLYYALAQGKNQKLLPADLTLSFQVEAQAYLKDKEKRILHQVQTQEISNPYDYIECVRNYHWGIPQELPALTSSKEKFHFFQGTVLHKFEKFDQQLAQRLIALWDPLRWDPVAFWKSGKNLAPLQQQLVENIWLAHSRIEATFLILRYCALGFARSEPHYNDLVLFNQWQETLQKERFLRFTEEIQKCHKAHTLHLFLKRYAQNQGGEPHFKEDALRLEFETELKAFHQLQPHQQH
jgi:hypothetical protein